jgi:hypothetical protein
MSRVLSAAALTAAALLLPLAGCSGWQANKSSQAVDFDPSAYGAMLSPSNAPGFMDGDAQDMRTKH